MYATSDIKPGQKESLQIKIFLVEDHEIVRQGLKALLESQCTVIGEASSGVEAIEKLEQGLPDILLMDMNMPIMNGAECARVLKQKYPEVKILILSMHDDAGYLLDSLRAGADGYILKNSSTDELVLAIRKVAKGEKFISTELIVNILDNFKHQPEKKTEIPLDITGREMDVLKLIGEGFTNSEIADKLFTSVRTIETRRKNLLEKTKTTNTATLIKFAVKNGLLD